MKKLYILLAATLFAASMFAQDYGILVNGNTYFDASYEGPDPYGGGYEQYLAHVQVNSGDYCQLYDRSNQSAWAVTLDNSTVSGFTLSGDRYTVTVSGCYDFYIKIKYQSDQLYIGNGSNCGTGEDISQGGGGGDPVTPQDYASAVPDQCTDIMLQGFYWRSNVNSGYGDTKWATLSGQADEISRYFTMVWLPPSSQASGISAGGLGYIPLQYSSQTCLMGKRAALESLIGSLHNKGVRVIADIVINHIGNPEGNCTLKSVDFGQHGSFTPNKDWLTRDDEGGCGSNGNNDDGQHEANYGAARDWDHTSTQVQNMCKAYLKWLKSDMKYDGFRYDYVGGYHVSHINDYNTASKPYFSVIEYWMGDANELKTRIDEAGKNTLAFDFAAKYTAFRDGIYSKDYTKCLNSGLRGKGYSKYAVTFVDNHDTFNRGNDAEDVANKRDGSSINDESLMMRCNAYLLSMPGVPCVFYPHWVKYKSSIQKMITARRMAGIHSESSVQEEATAGYYRATVQGKYGSVKLMLGSAANDAAPAGYTLALKGSDYAIYYTGNGPQAVENTTVTPQGEKFVRNGQLLIRRGEQVYDLMGRKLTNY